MRSGLSQPELASLLGISPSLLSKVESLTRRPTARVILAAEIVFGRPARDIFPGPYTKIEQAVLERAKDLKKDLTGPSHPGVQQKRETLNKMVERIENANKRL